MMKIILTVCLLTLCTVLFSSQSYGKCPQVRDPRQAHQPGLLPGKTQSVNPRHDRPVSIPYFVPEVVKSAVLTIFSPDGDALRMLKQDNVSAGEHHFTWDGADSGGIQVPNEAYIPVLTVETKDGRLFTDDPREYSGGEILPEVSRNWRWSNTHDISLNLDAPSRVLARAAIAGGPMVKNISHWEAKSPGRVVLRWDGYDSEKLSAVSKLDNLSVLVMAYCLPAHTLVRYGADSSLSYHDYRKKMGFQPLDMNIGDITLHRKGVRLEKNYLLPRYSLPSMTLSFPDGVMRNSAGEFIISAPTQLKTSIPQDQRWLIESSLYEVGYFHDFTFVQEEEQGYLPLYWPIDPEQFSPGRHIVTVQISAFNGIFLSKSVAIVVSDETDASLSRAAQKDR